MRQILIGTALLLAACSDSASGEDAAAQQPADNATASAEGVADGAGRRFDVTGFDAISLRGPDNVVTRVGPDFSVTATGDAEALEALRVRRDGGTLIVERRQGRSRGEATVTVTLPRLLSAAIAGAGDITIDSVRDNDLDLGIAGAGDIRVGTLSVGMLSVNIAGAGSMALSGTAQSANISVAGAGDVDAAGLVASRAEVSTMGAGDVSLTVNGPANLSTMGVGDISIGGRPDCTISRAGVGDVTCG